MTRAPDERPRFAPLGSVWKGLVIGFGLLGAFALFAPHFWTADLLANLALQWLIVASLIAVVVIRFRRWALLAVILAGSLPMIWMMVESPRAAFGETAPPEGESIRILVFNATTRNRSPERVLQLIRESRADVAIILEAPLVTIGQIRDADALGDEFAHHHLPDRAGAGFPVVLSRWPFEQIRRPDEEGRPLFGPRGVTVDRPEGAFHLIVAHPRSPRTARRWREGNDSIERIIARVNGPLKAMGLPIVVAGDFNSTPSGWRSRHLSRATELRRAKPRRTRGTTWPSQLFWPFQIAIDDVFVSREFRIVGWRRLAAAGSDHHAVEVEVKLVK